MNYFEYFYFICWKCNVKRDFEFWDGYDIVDIGSSNN